MTTNLFVEEAGQEHHQTIIFLHATGSSSRMWRQHMATLANDFHCMAIDLPGHGKSVVTEWTNFDDVADKIVNIIQTKAHGKPHLVGLSLGASLALKLLERQPDLLGRVMIDGASHQPIKGYRKVIATVYVASFLKNTKFVANMMSKMMEADGVVEQDVQLFIEDMKHTDRKAFRRAMSQANLLRLNLKVANPVFLVSGGKESPSMHESHQLLASQNNQSDCAYYPDKGHAWLFSDVATHIQLVQHFLQGGPFPEKLRATLNLDKQGKHMIKQVDSHSLSDWSALASTVWQTERTQLEADFKAGAFPNEYILWQNGRAIAFISLSIRKDYVEGVKASPVAYLEGIGVLPEYQRSGIAKDLIDFASKWARERSIRQLASNCELDNLTSQAFHSAVGFKEVSRTVNYVIDC